MLPPYVHALCNLCCHVHLTISIWEILSWSVAEQHLYISMQDSVIFNGSYSSQSSCFSAQTGWDTQSRQQIAILTLPGLLQLRFQPLAAAIELDGTVRNFSFPISDSRELFDTGLKYLNKFIRTHGEIKFLRPIFL